MPLRQKQHQPVVVAEADTTQRQDIQTHLRKAGFTVVEAADTETTMSALEGRSDVRALVTNTHLTTQLMGWRWRDRFASAGPQSASS